VAPPTPIHRKAFRKSTNIVTKRFVIFILKRLHITSDYVVSIRFVYNLAYHSTYVLIPYEEFDPFAPFYAFKVDPHPSLVGKDNGLNGLAIKILA
jgi:hypothetical protein